MKHIPHHSDSKIIAKITIAYMSLHANYHWDSTASPWQRMSNILPRPDEVATDARGVVHERRWYHDQQAMWQSMPIIAQALGAGLILDTSFNQPRHVLACIFPDSVIYFVSRQHHGVACVSRCDTSWIMQLDHDKLLAWHAYWKLT